MKKERRLKISWGLSISSKLIVMKLWMFLIWNSILQVPIGFGNPWEIGYIEPITA